MKELRAFFELTSLTLAPLLVLLLALSRDPGAAAAFGQDPPVATAEAASGERRGTEAVAVFAPQMAAMPADDVAAMSPASWDASVTVTIRMGEELTELCLRDYLLGVVAAEMPAGFQPEALKAQAVAARTDTFYRMLVARPHGDADCCTDPGCCKAYLSPEELQARWGADYEALSAKLAAAVAETDGVILTYEGQPIFAAFHAASDGWTECSENVWLAALPYLRSVPTGETEADVPRFRETVTVTAGELAELLETRCGVTALPDSPEDWLTGAQWSEAGRLLRVQAGDVSLSGSSLRSLLKLRSAAVTWTVQDGCFVFETVGYGHGVGMSQYGAEVMAEAGTDYGSILRHYYPGAELSGAEDVFPA